jgi:hypothetical protein
MLLQERQGLVPKIEADFDADVKPVGPRAKIPTVTVPASGSHETRRWRKTDSNSRSHLDGELGSRAMMSIYREV